VDGKNVGKKR